MLMLIVWAANLLVVAFAIGTAYVGKARVLSSCLARWQRLPSTTFATG